MVSAALCVSLTPAKLEDIFLSDIRGADLAEVRLDYLENLQDAMDVRWDRLPVPVIATCRGKSRGGLFAGSAGEELRILERAVANGARYVDVDYRIFQPFPGAEVVASYHDFSGTPDDIGTHLDRAIGTGAAIAKVAARVNTWSDNRTLFNLMSRHPGKRAIIVGMGEIGQITRILGPSRGNAWTYATVPQPSGEPSAPGQLSTTEMLGTYRFRKIRRSTKMLGVLGDPVGHSLSPELHNPAFELRGLDFIYVKLPAPDLRNFFDNATAIGIHGFSVTIPHKTAAIQFVADLTPEALETGAINTVTKTAAGWAGDNTDVHGVRTALQYAGFDPADRSVVILGSGGAAKAAVVAVKNAKEVLVLSRRPQDKQSWGRNVRFGSPSELQNHRCDLLVNATPVGMYPHTESSPVDGQIPAALVFDMVYNPPVTRLLRAAADQGRRTIPGATMFLSQAARQFEIWTGQSAPQEVYGRGAERS